MAVPVAALRHNEYGKIRDSPTGNIIVPLQDNSSSLVACTSSLEKFDFERMLFLHDKDKRNTFHEKN